MCSDVLYDTQFAQFLWPSDGSQVAYTAGLPVVYSPIGLHPGDRPVQAHHPIVGLYCSRVCAQNTLTSCISCFK